MPTNDVQDRAALRPGVAVGAGLGALTLVTHAANFGFVALAGRLLPPGDFANLMALLGLVLIGLAPGLAVQALTAAGVLGRPALVDRQLGRRLGNQIGFLVLLTTLGAWVLLDLTSLLVLVAVPVAAAVLPRTGVNEGLLQGRHRFVTLGLVMVAGALVKLTAGTAAMVVTEDLGVITVGLVLGYVGQLAASTRATTGDVPVREPTHGGLDLAYAVGVMGALLALFHLDAILAPALLADAAAGQYGVGVTATRVTFWLPQFAILLWFPRMVRLQGRGALLLGLIGVVGLGLLGAGAAVLLGPWAARTFFGPELGAVGGQLWRFVWVGTAALVLQVLTLTDLATGRRRAWLLLVPALLTLGAILPLSAPTTAVDAATVVAIVLSTAASVGAAWSLATLPRHRMSA